LRGIPAGGVGVTPGVDGCGIIVLATPIVFAPIDAPCDGAGAGAFAGPEPAAAMGCAGALRAGCGAAAPGDCDVKRCPQCWQNAKPTGVPLPHAGQIALAACAAAAAAGAGATGAGATGASVAATVAADASGAAAALAISDVPHILQKFIPGGLTVPHALQVVAPAAAAGFGAAAASRRWPQS
jgi:hypothetical protein